jgi:hypothetical protein
MEQKLGLQAGETAPLSETTVHQASVATVERRARQGIKGHHPDSAQQVEEYVINNALEFRTPFEFVVRLGSSGGRRTDGGSASRSARLCRYTESPSPGPRNEYSTHIQGRVGVANRPSRLDDVNVTYAWWVDSHRSLITSDDRG